MVNMATDGDEHSYKEWVGCEFWEKNVWCYVVLLMEERQDDILQLLGHIDWRD